MHTFDADDILVGPSWEDLAELARGAALAAEVPRGDHAPPLAVLHALCQPRPKPYRLTEAEIVALGNDAWEMERAAKRYFLQKALDAAEIRKGQHKPSPHVLTALRYPRVRRASPATTKYNFAPGRLNLAAQRAREERARHVLVRRGRRVPGLLPEELGQTTRSSPKTIRTSARRASGAGRRGGVEGESAMDSMGEAGRWRKGEGTEGGRGDR
jgi:hypothetical protein